jgi:hypothetical protein
MTTDQWVDLGGSVTGNGSTNCVTDVISGNEKRFYRVVELP